ncbi:MAG: isochorismatase family protein [Pseudomonadota bacterium]
MPIAALVIDVQAGLVPGSYNETQVLSAIQTTISKVRLAGGAIVYIQHCHNQWEPLKKGNPGWALHPFLDTRETDVYVEKTASDAFYDSTLAQLLDEHNISDVVIMGLQTEYCVDATCRAALSRGFEVTLIKDGHTTGDSLLNAELTIAHHNSVLENLAHPRSQIRVVTGTDYNP